MCQSRALNLFFIRCSPSLLDLTVLLRRRSLVSWRFTKCKYWSGGQRPLDTLRVIERQLQSGRGSGEFFCFSYWHPGAWRQIIRSKLICACFKSDTRHFALHFDLVSGSGFIAAYRGGLRSPVVLASLFRSCLARKARGHFLPGHFPPRRNTFDIWKRKTFDSVFSSGVQFSLDEFPQRDQREATAVRTRGVFRHFTGVAGKCFHPRRPCKATTAG